MLSTYFQFMYMFLKYRIVLTVMLVDTETKMKLLVIIFGFLLTFLFLGNTGAIQDFRPRIIGSAVVEYPGRVNRGIVSRRRKEGMHFVFFILLDF